VSAEGADAPSSLHAGSHCPFEQAIQAMPDRLLAHFSTVTAEMTGLGFAAVVFLGPGKTHRANGFSAEPPAGPATPVIATAQSAPLLRNAP